LPAGFENSPCCAIGNSGSSRLQCVKVQKDKWCSCKICCKRVCTRLRNTVDYKRSKNLYSAKEKRIGWILAKRNVKRYLLCTLCIQNFISARMLYHYHHHIIIIIIIIINYVNCIKYFWLVNDMIADLLRLSNIFVFMYNISYILLFFIIIINKSKFYRVTVHIYVNSEQIKCLLLKHFIIMCTLQTVIHISFISHII